MNYETKAKIAKYIGFTLMYIFIAYLSYEWAVS